ncbi:UDP-N-acetyl-D-mannosamine dehydrogenase [Paracoccus fistulariae]|uniref:UDP-N-acetyl-D-mannosamine dehydrogenase n=1 Tax=Paracoccus fistulariae TaxID=658446 RepID=A0ABY7SQB4_9RHOB|nr:UDP-N-acetyl-D-mannosamine dehydrogenase [Paracoccus fistulariae]MDB6183144.1 UDP-N-acetyl-D-mannosamine dehydrogenase [Paracoccus fistulariae]WCR09209.1 UDP-N-acetyl-D-mannosamine dehydrogenase [Paracoccus fistulariae]
MKFDSICMVGLGYIGLPTAVVFALRGVKVIGLDVNASAVDKINRGETHIVEPGLEDALRRTVDAGHLRATTTPEPADAFLIAVPTPFCNGHEPDLTYVEAAARSIAPVLKKGDLVVLESTSPVGATEQMAGWLAEERADLSFPQTAGEEADIRIAHCPERILPGHALRELVSNDRVIGGMTAGCASRARALYKLAVEGDCIETDCRTAEMAKLTENSFRDVNIAFANELSLICDRLDINVWELIRLANRHPRVNILQPGPGVGGHCIAVDPWFIVSQAPEEARIIRAAREINDGKPEWVLAKVHQAVAEHAATSDRPARIACFGLAFKPNIDDLRESPALNIARRLTDLYPGQVDVVEPFVKELPEHMQGKANLLRASDALSSSDIVVLLVDHDDFKAMPSPTGKRIIDTRGVWTGRPV